MPWIIRKKGSIWLVISKTSGKVKGRHKSYAQARAQQKALYHAVPESKG